MFGSLDTSTSALVANRVRMEVVAANLANANSLVNEAGENVPFRRRIAILAEGAPSGSGSGTSDDATRGVHVQQIKYDDAPFQLKYDPDHPLAVDGYIKTPNIDPIYAQINALEISRAYEANLQAAQATKSMMQASLRLLA